MKSTTETRAKIIQFNDWVRVKGKLIRRSSIEAYQLSYAAAVRNFKDPAYMAMVAERILAEYYASKK